ncbi:hypothetical protein ACFE04_027250 [Oxalis oulophora]
MPPEVPYYRPLLTPFARSFTLSSPESQLDSLISNKAPKGSNKKMNFPGKKIIPLLVFILSTFSILRFLRITITTTSSSPSPSSHTLNPSEIRFRTSANLTKKEFKLLEDLIIDKTPCNLLIFGLQHEYLKLSTINAKGITVFLEDDPDKIRTIKPNTNTTQIYKVNYHTPAKKAYQLLKHARRNPACVPNSKLLQQSACKLALTNLPRIVNDNNWDVVVVDGPASDMPEAPGRMASIYTAGVIARAGNITHVVVHDVDRTIEKWFSWEFLCEENLISSKGKFWNFRIQGHSNFTSLCLSVTAPAWQ